MTVFFFFLYPNFKWQWFLFPFYFFVLLLLYTHFARLFGFLCIVTFRDFHQSTIRTEVNEKKYKKKKNFKQKLTLDNP